ncbi:DUF58 domain-containing protein [Marinobacter persicus]|uniref:Uncharacterized protein DUF58 n=1 Tax=Marinobacter persicus TaxID=930118 RepID=A0A2S6G7H3_9GAMM|nr:DUF58 domain-containing protein [Marinobacter persicus]PPK51953.1 uncharacterized protein DUF58 [Marinobacter persicus]PPK54989.1 uncharacterized protein DUF58 [Marinobacter persicus]PPK58350.1 uncharacterized protein DUF58 [Marinobacter persicus]
MSAPSEATHVTLSDLVRLQADARALRLPSVKPARSRQAGLKQSRQRGRGMTFAEVRPYQPGDDIRSIDWRVTARRQSPHTKIYEEERERPVLLVADLGPTLFFASTGAYKQVRCAQLSALLAWLALRAGDQVGGLVFNETTLEVVRPARRKKSVLRLLDHLARQQHQPGSAPANATPANRLDVALAEARRVAHTGSRIFVISDFMTPGENTRNLLGQLGRHNTVTAIRIQDPLEKQLPEKGRYAVAGPDGPLWFDAGNPVFREAWQQKVDSHEQQLNECFRTTGVGFTTVVTGEAPTESLRRLLGPGGRIP